VRVTVNPGGTVGGEVRVPGDKSIAHRWLILGATAEGRSELRGLPLALDVRSTAKVLAAIAPEGVRAALEAWASQAAATAERQRSTANEGEPRPSSISLEAQGRVALRPPEGDLDCGNSGTTMRLMAGVLASYSVEARLTGDDSLTVRPMERVAEPLRAMGADVRTTGGRPPVTVRGGPLDGIRHVAPVPSAQVKGAVLLAGLAAEGPTTVEEPVSTRDHTERAIRHLGGPVRTKGSSVTVSAFRHPGFQGEVPGDISSAAFLVVATALAGGSLVIHDVGLNPTRTHLLDVLSRMGVHSRPTVDRDELGEPAGTLEVEPPSALSGITVEAAELPLLIDEVPVLAILAANAAGRTRFRGAAELRVKEIDRLAAIAGGIRALGGQAEVDSDDLVIEGGGLRGGTVSSLGDHRMAMAFAVSGIAASGPVVVEGLEAAEISFPGFARTLAALGARIEP
jgi:3-phosphoshikimate 1-carboxyvinyltransferase